MRRLIFTSLLGLTIATGLVATASSADFEFIPLGPLGPESQSFAPSVAISPGGTTMVAYNTSGVVLMTFVEVQQLATHGAGLPEALPDPVVLGQGYGPRIGWSRNGWFCAYGSGSMLFIAETDLTGTWDLENQIMIPMNGEVTGIDLWGVPTDAAGPSAFLAVQVWRNPPSGGYETYYLGRTGFGWDTPELVLPETAQSQYPQVTFSYGPAGPWPTLLYLTEDPGQMHLWSTTRDLAAGWSTPVEVFWDGVSIPTGFGGPFDVVRHWDFRTNILGVGPQPTCPCRSILHQEFDGSVLTTEDLTAHHDTYDQAMSPSLARDDHGRTHAFWVQEASDADMNPRWRTLEYRIREGGAWADHGDLLASQNVSGLGSSVALDVSDVGYPVLAWTRTDTIEGVPQGSRVWIGRMDSALSPVPEDVPRRAAAISAWPNPFNPRVELAVEIAAPGDASLTVYDARGCVVDVLIDGFLAAGRHEAAWNGTDRTGRRLPSGVYFARLKTVDAVEVKKLVLAK